MKIFIYSVLAFIVFTLNTESKPTKPTVSDRPPIVCDFVCLPNVFYGCCPNPRPLCSCCTDCPTGPYPEPEHGKLPTRPPICFCPAMNITRPCCVGPPIPGQCYCGCIYSRKCNNLPGPIICHCPLINGSQPLPCCTGPPKPGQCQCDCQQCYGNPWHGLNGWLRVENLEPRRLMG